MKFVLSLLPSIPCTLEERESLRPIAARTDRYQQMLDEVGELARIAEDVGFEIITTVEHHLHEEGLEMGGTSAFHHYIASQTKHIKVGPIGYVLPAWNPLRLAIETSWLSQLTRGRNIVGIARGYQTRWFNNMAQKYGAVVSRGGPTGGAQSLGTAMSDKDAINRELFEEVYDILELAWKNEPFAYKGKYWEYPSPFEEGTDWPAASWTEKFGTPGIVVDGKLKKINVVPKPFENKPPQVFTAFSSSEATIKWAAQRQIIPTITTTSIDSFERNAVMYRDAAQAAGHNFSLGENIMSARLWCLGESREAALKMADITVPNLYYRLFGGGFGFWEGFRLPGDEERWPLGKVRLPASEWTMDRLERSGHLVAGTVSDIRNGFDEMVACANPEYMQLSVPQGMIPFDEQVKMLRAYGEKIMPHYL
ncbi:MAG: LLM class flavin-dependent oxidoreductase [Spongiibacteraceae bacterium]